MSCIDICNSDSLCSNCCEFIDCYSNTGRLLQLLLNLNCTPVRMALVCSTGSKILLLATLLRFSACDYSARDQVLYVQPVSGTSCPGLPCHQLSYYVGDPELQSRYLRSNTTLHFIPGVHVFSDEILVDIRSVENFALVGTTNQSIIWCTKPAGFFFSRVAVLSIHGLVFVDCGIDLASLNELLTSDYLPLRATLCFSLVTHLNISQTAVINGTGHGFLALNVLGNVSIYHSILWSNKGRPEYSGGNALFRFSPIEEECLEFKDRPFFFTVESTWIGSGSTTSRDIFTSSPGLHIYINSCLKVFVRIRNSIFFRNGYEDNDPVFGFGFGGNMFLMLSHDGVNSSSHSVVIENSTFAGGKSFTGGGLSIMSNSKTCTPTATDINPDIVHILNSTFCYNLALQAGGGMYIAFDPNSCWTTHVFMSQLVLKSNYVSAKLKTSGGNLHINDNQWLSRSPTAVTANLVKIDSSNISNGHAIQGIGGGLSITMQYYLITTPGQPVLQNVGLTVQISNTMFMRNNANYGGAISMSNTEYGQGSLQVINCTFEDNYGEFGMAVYSYAQSLTGADSKLHFEDTTFIYHTVTAPFTHSTIYVFATRHVQFFNCELNHNMGTAILAVSSRLYFEGNLSFWNNTGENGGALSLCTNSVIFLLPNTYAYFCNNHARNSGGAIYVQQECAYLETVCFFQPVLPFNAFLPATNISLHFDNNTAGRAGDALYGGSVDECALTRLFVPSHALFAGDYVQRLDPVSPPSARLTMSSVSAFLPAGEVKSWNLQQYSTSFLTYIIRTDCLQSLLIHLVFVSVQISRSIVLLNGFTLPLHFRVEHSL